jgi:hypothetical protein
VVEGVPISGLDDEQGLDPLVFCPVAPGTEWFLEEILYAALAIPALAYRFVSGSLTLHYEVDNVLGGLNPGIYINGIALPSSTGIGLNSFTGLATCTDSSVTADLVQGTNGLYIDAVNLGAEGGLIFSADIATVNSTAPVPEPSTFSLMPIGLGLMMVMRKRIAQGLPQAT